MTEDKVLLRSEGEKGGDSETIYSKLSFMHGDSNKRLFTLLSLKEMH